MRRRRPRSSTSRRIVSAPVSSSAPPTASSRRSRARPRAGAHAGEAGDQRRRGAHRRRAERHAGVARRQAAAHLVGRLRLDRVHQPLVRLVAAGGAAQRRPQRLVRADRRLAPLRLRARRSRRARPRAPGRASAPCCAAWPRRPSPAPPPRPPRRRGRGRHVRRRRRDAESRRRASEPSRRGLLATLRRARPSAPIARARPARTRCGDPPGARDTAPARERAEPGGQLGRSKSKSPTGTRTGTTEGQEPRRHAQEPPLEEPFTAIRRSASGTSRSERWRHAAPFATEGRGDSPGVIPDHRRPRQRCHRRRSRPSPASPRCRRRNRLGGAASKPATPTTKPAAAPATSSVSTARSQKRSSPHKPLPQCFALRIRWCGIHFQLVDRCNLRYLYLRNVMSCVCRPQRPLPARSRSIVVEIRGSGYGGPFRHQAIISSDTSKAHGDAGATPHGDRCR